MRHIDMDIYSKMLLAGSALLLLFTVMVLVWVTRTSGEYHGDVFVLQPPRSLSEDSQVSLLAISASAPTFEPVVYPGSLPLFLSGEMLIDIKMMSKHNWRGVPKQ